jgi:hypothetical protein
MHPHHQPTDHQLALLAAYAETGSTGGTASALGLAERTVKNELSTLYGQLGVHGRFGALTSLGWVALPRGRPPRRPPAGSPLRWRSFVLATYVRAGSVDAAAADLGETSVQVRTELSELYRELGVRGALEAIRTLGWLRVRPTKTAH